jgi:hypothetical protein
MSTVEELQGALFACEHHWRAVVEDLVHQFAYTGSNQHGPMLHTGGLSALELAFDALGWNDPHQVPERACNAPGCLEHATSGIPTTSGYMNLCYQHARMYEGT